MKNLEAIITHAYCDTKHPDPVVVRVAGAIRRHLVDSIWPFVSSEDSLVRSVAQEIHTRFILGLMDESSPSSETNHEGISS